MVVLPRRCITCSYNLMGLPVSGPCPECGTPVAHSLRDNLLINSSPDYLARIHKGVFLVQTAIIVAIVLFLLSIFGGIGAMFLMSRAATPGPGAATVTNWSLVLAYFGGAISLVTSVIGLYGWWLFSDADPRSDSGDRGEKPRRIVRATLAIEFALLVLSQSSGIASQTALAGAGVPVLSLQVATIVFTIGYYIALAVRYFASMLYVRWLAPRIPNPKAHTHAKRMLWLGPVLCTVGALACYIGPLVALVMYYNLLDWVRIDLKRIRKTLELKSLAPASS